MAFDSYGAPQFGLRDVKVGTWDGDGTYTGLVDIPSVQLYGAILKIVSAQLEGDDEITASAARAIAGESRLRFGSVSIAALEIILGNLSTTSGAAPSAQDHFQVDGGDNMPYFGICGKALAEEGVGDLHVFLPKVRVMQDVELATLQYGQFAIPELTVTAVSDAGFGIINLIEHQADTEIVLPPAGLSWA